MPRTASHASPGSIVQFMKSLLQFWGARFTLPLDMEGLKESAFEQMVKLLRREMPFVSDAAGQSPVVLPSHFLVSCGGIPNHVIPQCLLFGTTA